MFAIISFLKQVNAADKFNVGLKYPGITEMV